MLPFKVHSIENIDEEFVEHDKLNDAPSLKGTVFMQSASSDILIKLCS